MTFRHDLAMLGPVAAGCRSEEQLVAGFSARLDDHVGRFLGRPHEGRWVCDRQLVAILGYPRNGSTWSLQTLLEQVPDDEREMAAGAFDAGIDHGYPVQVSCRLHGADGTLRSVLIIADLMEAEPTALSMANLLDLDGLAGASGPWMAGQLIDLTALRRSATRAAGDQAVAKAMHHRAVIEQAKGILMLAHGIDADAAFLLLARHSQDTNTKLHDLAARLVDQATVLKFDTAAPAHIDALLSGSP